MDDTMLRQRWHDALGGFPPPTPLHAAVTERVTCPEYRRETVEFWSEPTERVIAYLLIPHALAARAPAIVCIHQHNGEYTLGKSEPAGLMGNPAMAYAHELATQGFITIAPDLKGFESRGDATLDGRRYEQFLASQAIVRGDTLQRRHLWDLRRTVDYLHERPEVAPERIGCIGHSLGGQEAFFLMATDPRVRAGVSSCGVGTVQSFFDHRITHNLAWYLPGYLALGDTPALLRLIAPRSLCIIASEHDPLFPLEGVRQIIDAAAPLYCEYAGKNRFLASIFDGAHAFPAENRATAYAWLHEQLDYDHASA